MSNNANCNLKSRLDGAEAKVEACNRNVSRLKLDLKRANAAEELVARLAANEGAKHMSCVAYSREIEKYKRMIQEMQHSIRKQMAENAREKAMLEQIIRQRR